MRFGREIRAEIQKAGDHAQQLAGDARAAVLLVAAATVAALLVAAAALVVAAAAVRVARR